MQRFDGKAQCLLFCHLLKLYLILYSTGTVFFLLFHRLLRIRLKCHSPLHSYVRERKSKLSMYNVVQSTLSMYNVVYNTLSMYNVVQSTLSMYNVVYSTLTMYNVVYFIITLFRVGNVLLLCGPERYTRVAPYKKKNKKKNKKKKKKKKEEEKEEEEEKKKEEEE